MVSNQSASQKIKIKKLIKKKGIILKDQKKKKPTKNKLVSPEL